MQCKVMVAVMHALQCASCINLGETYLQKLTDVPAKGVLEWCEEFQPSPISNVSTPGADSLHQWTLPYG